MDERQVKPFDRNLIVKKQFIVIILMHITGFLILSYNKSSFGFNFQKLVFGFVSILFFISMIFVFQKIYKNSCPLIWNTVIFLLDISIIMLTRLNFKNATRQFLWQVISLVFILFIPKVFNYIKTLRELKTLKNFYLISSFVLTFSTFFLGERINGSLNWIKIGSLTFQPSEIVKFLFIFYLASAYSEKITLKKLILPMFFAASMTLSLTLQKDLGGALIFFTTYMVVTFIATGSYIFSFLGIFSFSIASVMAYKLFDHVKVRVQIWQNPWTDYNNKGYQIINSLFAIGTWGLFGSGLTRGKPETIPVVVSDFIFSAITEEFGGIFALCLLGIFVSLYYRGVHISLRSKNKFYSLLAAGLTSILVFQTFLIVGGNVKFIPLTGVTLPFLSFGGTSVISCLIMVGVIQWIFTVDGEVKKVVVNKV